MGRYYLILGFLICWNSLFCQSFIYTSYGVNEGLNVPDINCINQDEEGYLWIGTSLGLSRFDGNRFHNFTNSDSINFGPINKILTTEKNQLIIASQNGLFLKEGITISWIQDSLIKNQVINDIQLVLDTLWIATKKGIYKSPYKDDLSNVTFQKIVNAEEIIENKSKANILCIEIDPINNQLWFGTNYSVFNKSYKGIKKIWTQPGGAQVLSIVKWNQKLLFSTKYRGAFTIESGKTNNWFENTIYTRGIFDDDKSWQIIKNDTLYEYDKKSEILLQEIPLNSFSNQFLISSFKDNEGQNWICTKEGLIKINPSRFQNIPTDIPNELYSIYIDQQDKIYGSNRGRVYQLNEENTIASLNFALKLPTRSELFDIQKFEDQIYMATGYDGIYVLGKQLNLKNQFTDLLRQSIYNFETIDNKLYAIGDQGYTIIKNDSAIYKSKLSNDDYIIRFNDLVRIHDQTFVSAKEGLYKDVNNTLEKCEFEDPLLNNISISAMELYNDSLLYISTFQNGLLVCDFQDNKIRRLRSLDKSNGLLSKSIVNFEIINDHLLLLHFDGISIFSLEGEDEKWHSQLTESNGFKYVNYKSGQFEYSNDTVWFVSTKGIGYFSLEDQSNWVHVPKATSINYTFKGKSYEINTLNNFISLPYGAEQIEINYSSLNYLHQSNQLIQSRLHPYDKDWEMSSKEHLRYFRKLDHGAYTFKIKDFKSNNTFDVLSLKIETPFYKTWLFSMLIAGLAIAIIYYLIKKRISRIRKENQSKLDLLNSRLNALRGQMNPHFIFNSLNSIDAYIAKNDRIHASEYLNSFASLIRKSLSHSRTDLISLADEMELVDNYIHLEQDRFEKKFSYTNKSVHKDLYSDIQVPSFIIQAFVENAIWHGLSQHEDQAHLTISDHLKGNVFTLQIVDNGPGYLFNKKPDKKYKRPSLGTTITKERIQLINKVYDLGLNIEMTDLTQSTGNEKGTKVTMTLVLKDFEGL